MPQRINCNENYDDGDCDDGDDNDENCYIPYMINPRYLDTIVYIRNANYNKIRISI